MLRFLSLILALLLPAPVPGQTPTDRFRAEALLPSEVRLVQAGLALAGRYHGLIDGRWGAGSARALTGYAREISPQVRDWRDVMWGDALLAALEAEEEFRIGGWAPYGFPRDTLSLAAPSALLAPRYDDPHPTVATPSRDLLVRMVRDGPSGTADMHEWLADNHVGGTELYRAVRDRRWITRGRLPGGKTVYLRSHRRGATWVTVLVQWEDGQAHRGRLIAASIAEGPQPEIAAPGHGILMRVLRALPGDGPAEADPPRVAAAPPGPAPPPPAPSARRGSGIGRGSGFFVGPDLVVTNDHVAGACGALRTAGGLGLTLIAADPITDLAVLRAARPGPAWLPLAVRAPRLGQGIHALGYPYAGVVDVGLSMTGGSVSALSDGGSPARLMISAPVQPGNSGGPVLDSEGRVAGVVVSRLDEFAVLARSGTLPQNMNFAIPVRSLRAFLADAGVTPVPAEGAPVADGLPDRMASAVVQVLCLP
ncbi:MAG: S1C family serine protease [Hasllibacter sp.]